MATEPRFLTLADVAEILNISTSQAYALVRNNELEAIKIGGRGQWRGERGPLGGYIPRVFQQNPGVIAKQPLVGAGDAAPEGTSGGGAPRAPQGGGPPPPPPPPR